MQYIDMTEEEAVDQVTGKPKEGYEKWAYSYKKVIPDTPEEIYEREKPSRAKEALKALIALMDPDPAKVKLDEVVAHLIQLEIILGLR
jgi:hypothetical protein